MPQNEKVSLGQRLLFLVLPVVCLAVGCTPTQKTPFTELPKSQADQIYLAVAKLDWKNVYELSKKGKDPLLQLVRQRALYELKNYDQLLSNPPIQDRRFAPYDTFLRMQSLYEQKKWDDLLKMEIPSDLPNPLRERLTILQGEAHQEKQEFPQAKEIFTNFLKKFHYSAFETDVLFRLADVELSLGNTDKAMEIYEKIYHFHPVDDSDDLAKRKLEESGRFVRIDTDVHLARIQKLQRAARFKRAETELEMLQQSAPLEQQPRIALAAAQLNFAERNYWKSEALAKTALRRKMPLDLEIEWRQILASSMARQSQSDDAKTEFKKLLAIRHLSTSVQEVVLYKLAMISLDDGDFQDAADYFDQLRKKFAHGNYIESAYWFGAWALFEKQAIQPAGADLEEVRMAIKLLDDLPNLPKAKVLVPQALYWKAQLSLIAADTAAKDADIAELQQDWPLSFHALLLRPKPFRFLDEKRLSPTLDVSTDYLIPDLSANAGAEKSFYHDISWQRLEDFRSVNLKTWGKMELDRFVDSSRLRGNSTLLAVAKRFQAVEDWSDLVHWAERYFDISVKDLDLKDPVVKFHYPRAYSDAVLKAAHEFDISPFLIWGIMREESRYETDAISRAGAVGLMQVMPFMGIRIGGILNDPQHTRERLNEAARNIRYGAYHLSELRARVADLDVPADLKPVLQVAAYNAGIDAVLKWIKEKDTSHVDRFVESIPYAETRYYVKRVLQSSYIYFRLYGDVTKEVAKPQSHANQYAGAHKDRWN